MHCVRVEHLTALLLAALPAVFAGSVKPTTSLTIVLDFNGSHSAQSVAAMERESQGILKDAGVALGVEVPRGSRERIL